MHQFGEAAPLEENQSAAALFYRVVRHRTAWSCAQLALLIWLHQQGNDIAPPAE
jgi:hypothetical protein